MGRDLIRVDQGSSRRNLAARKTRAKLHGAVAHQYGPLTMMDVTPPSALLWDRNMSFQNDGSMQVMQGREKKGAEQHSLTSTFHLDVKPVRSCDKTVGQFRRSRRILEWHITLSAADLLRNFLWEIKKETNPQ